MGGIFSGKGGGGGVFWDRTLPWDLSQIHPCTPLPGFSGGYERRREWEKFQGIISPGEWRLQGDQTLILMRRRPQIRSCSEAASNTLPGFYFISVMETQHSSLLFGSRDGSCRSEGWRGGSIMKTLSDHSPSRWHLNKEKKHSYAPLEQYEPTYKHRTIDSIKRLFCHSVYYTVNINPICLLSIIAIIHLYQSDDSFYVSLFSPMHIQYSSALEKLSFLSSVTVVMKQMRKFVSLKYILKSIQYIFKYIKW